MAGAASPQSYIASVVGCDRRKIANGIADLAAMVDGEQDNGRLRRPGGGRKKATEVEPQLVKNFLDCRAAYCG